MTFPKVAGTDRRWRCPLSRFASRVGGGSVFFARQHHEWGSVFSA
jgi:hypothetical protein